MMTVEERPDVTYNDIGGCKEQLERLREVLEMPMLNPEKFINLGIDPPKGKKTNHRYSALWASGNGQNSDRQSSGQ
jgi:hypothetical protein